MNSKLILGTVQFGVNYGINNNAGQVTQTEVNRILEYAAENGIEKLDTSSAYGNSEEALGNSNLINCKKTAVISKYPRCSKSPRECLNDSLKKLGVNSLYGYLIHHFDFYQEKPDIWTEIEQLKSEGLIQNIGFSLYTPEQLEYLVNNKVKFDIIQLPYNMFDRQFESYFPKLKELGVEIHTRSVFLQGLFFKAFDAFPEKLMPMRKYVEKLQNYCKEQNINIANLAVAYSISKQAIDGVLMGVDNCNQLQSNIECANYNLSLEDIAFVDSIEVKEKELLNPVNWK